MRLTADAPETAAQPPPADTPPPRPEPPLTVIRPGTRWTVADLKELWRFRELLWCLTVRDVLIRYKQTILGLGWAVVQPLATMLVFAVFIGWMGRAAEGVPNYTLFVLAGVLPWTFLANGVTTAALSLVTNEKLVTKTYFPRLMLPGSSVAASGFDFLIGLGLLAVWVAAAGVAPTWRLAVVPLVVLLVALTALGVGALLAALISAQRDFRYVLTFGVQLWMFATPCLYLPPDKYPIGPEAQRWLALNPAYGLVLNFRSGVLGEPLDWAALGLSAAVGLLLLAAGLVYFRRVEQTLADTI